MEDKYKDFKSSLINISKYLLVLLKKLIKYVRQLIKVIPSYSNRLKYYIKIWLLMMKNSFLLMLSQKKLFLLFLTGKIIRFLMFLTFIYFILKSTNSLAGYDLTQTIFIFLTFNLIDVTAQFLMREVYRFRSMLISGDFDLTLVKPMNSLFRILFGGSDVIDLLTLPPLIGIMIFVGSTLNPSVVNILFYIILIINGLFITISFHILVVSLGIITLEVDHTIMIYRDLTDLGKLPIEIYKQPIKEILTYIVPIGVMITIPAKSLFGMINIFSVIIFLILGGLLFFLSTRFWNYSLKSYTSASS